MISQQVKPSSVKNSVGSNTEEIGEEMNTKYSWIQTSKVDIATSTPFSGPIGSDAPDEQKSMDMKPQIEPSHFVSRQRFNFQNTTEIVKTCHFIFRPGELFGKKIQYEEK